MAIDELIFLIAFPVIWIGTIVYAYVKRREHFWMIAGLCLLGGPIGYFIAILFINVPQKPDLDELNEDVQSCPECGWLYKPGDYRDDIDILCSSCDEIVRKAITS